MSQEWTPNYSVCTETGLRICEILPHVWVRTDGKVRNTNPKGSRRKPDWHTGTLDESTGYFRVAAKRKWYGVHRLIIQAFNPSGISGDVIDHIDGVRTNNDIANLRGTTHRQNLQNQARHRSGRLVGASYHKRRKKWVASIRVDGTLRHLGSYASEELAHCAYLQASELL